MEVPEEWVAVYFIIVRLLGGRYNFRAVDTFMQLQPALNVYVHHDANDRQMVRCFRILVMASRFWMIGRVDAQTLVRDSHVVLFCVSAIIKKLRTRNTICAGCVTTLDGGILLAAGPSEDCKRRQSALAPVDSLSQWL
jgi:hypothetical protein